jgi:hypothetical protein
VQQQLDCAEWEERALSEVPNETEFTIPGHVTASLAEDLDTLHQALPKMPEIKYHLIDTSAATTSTTSVKVYQLTDNARHSSNSKIRDWGTIYGTQYENLQNQHGREQEVRNLLHNLKPELAVEFDQAVSEYRAALADTGSNTSAGIALRNVHDHYKGEIMNLARQSIEKQKITWQQMANQLVDDVGVARPRFQDQQKEWHDLQQCLSELAKGKAQLKQSELKSIFTKFIDHLHIVLSLINASRGQP